MKKSDLARNLLRILITVLGIVPALLGSRAVIAQESAGQWSQPLLLHETPCAVSGGATSLIADPYGMLHAFWACHNDPSAPDIEASPRDLFYARYDGIEWTEPIDIATDIVSIRVILDNQGTVHVFWSDDMAGTLYHMQNISADLGSAHSWSTPQVIGTGSTEFEVILDPDGVMHMILTPADLDVVYMRSTDDGATWTTPTSLISGGTATEAYRYGGLTIDKAGRLHAIWSSYPLPEAWPPQGIFYANSLDGGDVWSEPLNIRDERFVVSSTSTAQDEPAIVAADENWIHVMWNGGVATLNRYYRASPDGGQSWQPEQVIPVATAGIIGRPAMVVDSTGIVHAMSPSSGGLYYGTGREDRPMTLQRLTADSISDPALAISHGNRLHALAVNGQGAWYLERTIDAPYVEPAPLPDIAPTPTSAVTSTNALPAETLSTPAKTAIAATPDRTAPSQSSSLVPIVLGVLPAAALVLGVVYLRMVRRRQ